MCDSSNVFIDPILLDDLLFEKVPKEISDILIKKYRKELSVDKLLTKEKFEELLSSENMHEKHKEKLIKLYVKQKEYIQPHVNKNKYDSLLFLSKVSNKTFSNFKTKKYFRTKTLDFNKCIEHLQETERMDIICCDKYEEFMENNKIYFDDEYNENMPRKDVLYRKINNFFFVTNEDYFEKCTDFYFKLYSNIFAIFDLKCITLNYYSNISKIKETKASVQANVVELGGSSKTKNDKKNENEIKMEFKLRSKKNDRYNGFEQCKGTNEEVKFLQRELPNSLKKNMYNPSNILGLIKNRTQNELCKFEQIQTIENINTKRVEASLQSKFNLVNNLGIFGSYSESNYINKRVVFTMDFYDIFHNEKQEKQELIKKIMKIKNENKELLNNMEISQPLNIINEEKQEDDQEEKKTQQEQIEKKLTWINKYRNDKIPSNAVYAGKYNTDGDVYVGRIKISPGKVNTDKNKIWNYWVQNMNCSQGGQILICDYEYKWLLLNRGENIPSNAIYSGTDERGDKVWVGKSLEHEPGKITCIENKADPLQMKKLWCHSSWGSYSNAYILTVCDYEKDTINLIL